MATQLGPDFSAAKQGKAIAETAAKKYLLDKKEQNAVYRGIMQYATIANAMPTTYDQLGEKYLGSSVWYKITKYNEISQKAKAAGRDPDEVYKGYIAQNPYTPDLQSASQDMPLTAGSQTETPKPTVTQPETTVPVTKKSARETSKELASIQRDRNMEKMKARTDAAKAQANADNAAAQNQADADMLGSAATSAAATTPVQKGSQGNPLPNSVAAQAKATAGQWIMTKNGPYQLKQADIDWAKKKVSGGTAAAPKQTEYDKHYAEKLAEHKENNAADREAAAPQEPQQSQQQDNSPWYYTMKDGKVMYQDPENPSGPPQVSDSREQFNNIVRTLNSQRY